jgi:hypothetical protein
VLVRSSGDRVEVMRQKRRFLLSFRPHAGLLDRNQRGSATAMQRLVVLVGSTANKFEQTRSVRVRDFANRLHP